MGRILITGGNGFIGTNFLAANHSKNTILNIDKESNFYGVSQDNVRWEKHDLGSLQSWVNIVEYFKPSHVIHFAAESHVDKSIDSPGLFVESNITGTYNLLQSALSYWRDLSLKEKERFRLIHVSTDEVYGSIQEGFHSEGSPYSPASPYAASKASSDHLVQAWHKTYGLPTIITHCTNNFGPYQHPEKLIPHMIFRALQGKTLPVYGSGKNIRNWLYVNDHIHAIKKIVEQGAIGQTYNIAGIEEKTNLEVVTRLCEILDQYVPHKQSYLDQIEFVSDRPGHDFRYGIDDSKLRSELGWRPLETFDTGLEKTIRWYLDYFKDNLHWLDQQAIERQGIYDA